SQPIYWQSSLSSIYTTDRIFDEFWAPAVNQPHMTITEETRDAFLRLITTKGPMNCSSCGNEGQSCCGTIEASCHSGLACDHFNNRNICAPCGGYTQLCCPGANRC